MKPRILVLLLVAACAHSQPPTSSPPGKVMPVLIAGDEQIQASVAVKRAMLAAGQRKITASVKLCVDREGAVKSVEPITPSGHDAYDTTIRDNMQSWRYRPLMVDGKPAPFCKKVTFLFRMTEPYWSATAIALDKLHDDLIDQIEAAGSDCERMEDLLVTFAREHHDKVLTVHRELDEYERKVRETGGTRFGAGFGDAFLRRAGRYVMPCPNKDALTKNLFASGFRPAGPRHVDDARPRP